MDFQLSVVAQYVVEDVMHAAWDFDKEEEQRRRPKPSQWHARPITAARRYTQNWIAALRHALSGPAPCDECSEA